MKVPNVFGAAAEEEADDSGVEFGLGGGEWNPLDEASLGGEREREVEAAPGDDGDRAAAVVVVAAAAAAVVVVEESTLLFRMLEGEEEAGAVVGERELAASLKKMDVLAVRLLLVNSGKSFKGVLSIGDIQRAIIKNFN